MNVRVNETEIEQVSSYRYPGVIIDETGKHETGINIRIQKASNNVLYHE